MPTAEKIIQRADIDGYFIKREKQQQQQKSIKKYLSILFQRKGKIVAEKAGEACSLLLICQEK